MADSKFAQILITAKDSTRAGFDSAKANMREFQGAAARLDTSLAGVKAAATTLLPALAGLTAAFGAAGMATAVLNTANALDAFNDAADATGASIENLSALEAIALRNGASLDTVTDAIVKLNQALAEDSGGDKAKVLAAIGLSADDLRKQDPAEALQTVAQALAKFENDGNKARIVFELFGKSARELAPFLNDVAEAGGLVATVTAEQAAEAERFNKALSALGAEISLTGRAIGAELLPPITEFITAVNQARVAGASWAEQLRAGFRGDQDIGALRDRIREVDAELAKIAEKNSRPAGKLGGLLGLALDIDETKLINERIALVEKLRRAEEAARAAAVQPSDASGGRVAPDISKLLAKPDKAKVPKDTSDAMRRAAQEMVDGWSPLVLRWDLEDKDFNVNAQLADWVAASEERLEGLVAKYRDLADPVEKYRREIEVITALEAQGKLTAEEAFGARGKLYDEADKAAGDLNKTLEKQKSIGDELGLTFSSAFEDAIVKGGEFGDVLEGLAQDIARILIRKQITEPLGTALSDFASSLFAPSANGNAFGPGGLIPFAKGGVVDSPTFFKFANGGSFAGGVMGEAGPEAILPLKRGAGGKLGVVAEGAGGGGVVVQIINPPQQPTVRTVEEGGKTQLQVIFDQVDAQMAAGITSGRSRTAGAMQGTYGLRRTGGM